MSEPQLSTVDERRRSEASVRARAKLEFYKHIFTYVVIIGGLAVVNLMTSPGYLWFLWPAVGWGVGIVMHAINVFVFSDKILQRMIAREMRRTGPGRS